MKKSISIIGSGFSSLSAACYLAKMGHKVEASKTMGSTQSIHIRNNINYGFSDLRRPNAGVAKQ